MVRLIKSNSSKWFHETRGDDFQWQSGYAGFTVSRSHQTGVREYVCSQKEHHRKTTFRDEYLSFLRKHKIEFDLRYFFDGEHVG